MARLYWDSLGSCDLVCPLTQLDPRIPLQYLLLSIIFHLFGLWFVYTSMFIYDYPWLPMITCDYLSIFLSIYPCIHRSIYLPMLVYAYLSMTLYLWLSIYDCLRMMVYLNYSSIQSNPSIHPSIHPFIIHASIYLSIYLSNCLSIIHPSVHASIHCSCLFIYLFLHEASALLRIRLRLDHLCSIQQSIFPGPQVEQAKKSQKIDKKSGKIDEHSGNIQRFIQIMMEDSIRFTNIKSPGSVEWPDWFGMSMAHGDAKMKRTLAGNHVFTYLYISLSSNLKSLHEDFCFSRRPSLGRARLGGFRDLHYRRA